MNAFLVGLALKLFIGPVVYFLSERSQRALTALDNLSGATGAIVKQAFTVLWAAALAWLLVHVPGVCPSGDCTLATIDWSTLVKYGAGAALATHGIVAAAKRADAATPKGKGK